MDAPIALSAHAKSSWASEKTRYRTLNIKLAANSRTAEAYSQRKRPILLDSIDAILSEFDQLSCQSLLQILRQFESNHPPMPTSVHSELLFA